MNTESQITHKIFLHYISVPQLNPFGAYLRPEHIVRLQKDLESLGYSADIPRAKLTEGFQARVLVSSESSG